ncbi:MAG: hypothetical protein KJ941_07390, partial [Bacteroidetes bacterium]|nr:hypothetical protein [Bacteroidota bacterium]
LNSENYRKSLKQKGIFIPSQIEVNPSFVREFCLKNEQKNVQLSMTIAAPYFQIISQSIYVKGLTFYFSSILQDLYTENLILWEKGLAKQSLKVTGFTLNSNYLPILYQLRSGSVSSSSYGKKLPNEPYSEIINRIVDQLKLSENSKNY